MLHVRNVPVVREQPPLMCPGKSTWLNVGADHQEEDIDSPSSMPSQHISDTSTPEVFYLYYSVLTGSTILL